MDAISYSYADKAQKRIKKFIENPDSTSGIVTVPKTIASGETITIPTGRVAVLPNLVVDGTLNIDGDVFVPSGSTFGDLDTQIALKADTSYVNTQLGLKANTADLKEIGVGQTWQDVTASRVAGTTYTNTTGKPIALSITGSGGNGFYYIKVNGVNVVDNYEITGTDTPMFCIVPSGSTYSVTVPGGTIRLWQELR